MVAAITMDSRNKASRPAGPAGPECSPDFFLFDPRFLQVSSVDQLPRHSLALPCSNLVDAPGGYRGSTFGECTPVSVSPAITTHSLVAPNFDKLRSAPPAPPRPRS